MGSGGKIRYARFTMSNLKAGEDSVMVHFFFTWLVSLAVYASLSKLYKDFISLRHMYIARGSLHTQNTYWWHISRTTPFDSLHSLTTLDAPVNYTILVSDVPQECRSKVGVITRVCFCPSLHETLTLFDFTLSVGGGGALLQALLRWSRNKRSRW
jgi:hypothetical protein